MSLGDLLGSAAAMLTAAAVMVFGWLYADPVLTLAIVLILSRGAYGVLRESGHILLEGVPAGVNLAKIKSTLTEEVAGVDGVHHVHAWGLTAEKPLLTLHALIPENAHVQEVVADIKRLLKERFTLSTRPFRWNGAVPGRSARPRALAQSACSQPSSA